MMDGSDASQDLGATFLTTDAQLFVQSDGDGKTNLGNFISAIHKCTNVIVVDLSNGLYE